MNVEEPIFEYFLGLLEGTLAFGYQGGVSSVKGL